MFAYRFVPMERTNIAIYDTTLRDGAQQEGMSLTVPDKLRLTSLLDDFGVTYIEGGWPGAGPKDSEFFAQAGSLKLKNAKLVAFGSTVKPEGVPSQDSQVLALANTCAPFVTLVAKADALHVAKALRCTEEQNLQMVADTVSYLVSCGKTVMVDLEHFFDGLARSEHALRVADTALQAGAHTVIACDTNGGTLPDGVYAGIARLVRSFGTCVGIHAHNDSGCANANAILAVQAGARQVQVTANGYGERTGNSNLFTTVANLELKLGLKVLPDPQKLSELTHLSHQISEITNISPFARDPYVGSSAFAHKGGLHASAIKRDSALYQHISPSEVGNCRRMLVSEMSGRALVEMKAAELGLTALSPSLLAEITTTVKKREAAGYSYDGADASFELLTRQINQMLPSYFKVETWRSLVKGRTVSAEPTDSSAEATVELVAAGKRVCRTRAGNGPVNALDHAFVSALSKLYPAVKKFRLIDFKVRILDEDHGSYSTVRVLLEAAGPTGTWTTVGVGTNMIEASWEALTDSYIFGLIKEGVTPLEEPLAS